MTRLCQLDNIDWIAHMKDVILVCNNNQGFCFEMHIREIRVLKVSCEFLPQWKGRVRRGVIPRGSNTAL